MTNKAVLTERKCNICGKTFMMERYQRFCNGKFCRKKVAELYSTDIEYTFGR